jgi:Fe-S-cluster-containing dehydrogenase component
LLDAQQTLTAVERFSRKHDTGDVPAKEKYYKDLLPLERPRPGEQYAFEVDLDACTGCKACVAACHSLNGLDEDEAWRSVGLLHGGKTEAPALQTVTTSCHHCLEPACMTGCPTQAYEKDPVTGIVRHLDDQCFGCQYCTLMCPYDAPKYNKSRGIVRKCDMCSDRLAHGEAPACVQACPNEAIAIRIVDQAAAVQASEAQTFLPGAPAPESTLPTTVYKTKKAMPNNMLPADFYATRPEHSHPPLVVMLTLTQLSVGAFAITALIERLGVDSPGNPLAQTVFACALAMIALGASVFHLGRPLLAWRAFLGLRTSWLSREAVVFGGFAQFAIVYGALVALPLVPDFSHKAELAALAPTVHQKDIFPYNFVMPSSKH